jgi:hypothetical protein
VFARSSAYSVLQSHLVGGHSPKERRRCRSCGGHFDTPGSPTGSLVTRILIHVLNLHQQDNIIPKSKFEALEEWVSKQELKIRSLQTGCDKALSKHTK